MAEPARTRPPAASVAERDALLATKLHLPRPHPGFLARPRLLERLDESTARELTLVCVPAGFGKTTLLADWARTGQTPVAWLSLDEGDNDPVRFWRYVAGALDQVRAGIGQRRSWPANPSTWLGSCWRPRCWSGNAARCATPSPAAPTARSCWSTSSGPICSWWPS
jgi:hypothetical protein